MPLPAAGTGMRTSVRTSSGARAVVRRSLKKSSALMVRAPFGPVARSSAPRASTTAGQSAAGSAWARLPPIVPQLRTWGSPIMAPASVRIGHFALSEALDSIA